jgi:hypothetical protein
MKMCIEEAFLVVNARFVETPVLESIGFWSGIMPEALFENFLTYTGLETAKLKFCANQTIFIFVVILNPVIFCFGE